jgi:cytochrome d ubiquinol oxidase subunit I
LNLVRKYWSGQEAFRAQQLPPGVTEMDLDPVFLSRLQFAWVIGWHILLPAFTVGAAAFIAVLEGFNLATGRDVYLRVSMFWIKIFSIAFGMGVVTGVVMPFQLGTNWSRYSDATANVLAPLFAYEGLTAFFLEAAFLGVLLFGRKLVPRWAHFFAALMVALGTLFSSFWILSANSWMQTPAGYEIIDGRFFPKDWMEVVFSPSFPSRLAHTVVAFYITTGFVVLGVGAYLLRREQFAVEGRTMLSMTLWLLTALVPLQIFLGDHHGLNTLEHQPAKLAAIEARWETGRRIPLTLFAIPDEKTESNYAAIEVPLLGSLILTHRLDGEIKGLKDFPADQRPPVAIPFFAFRIMVGCGTLMLGIVLLGGWLRWRGRLNDTPLFLRLCQLAIPIGFVAVIAGWVTTEVGRQPWTVYGLMRTAASVSPSLTGRDVLISLLAYMAVYLFMYPAGLFLMIRIVRRGPMPSEEQDATVEAGRPQAPVLAGPGISEGSAP